MDTEKSFLKSLDKKLWTAADNLRSNLDAAVCKHAVLGLIFLKYVSDAFDIRQEQVEDDGITFAGKMTTLTSELADQFAESAKLEKAIRKNMKALGFELPVGAKK